MLIELTIQNLIGIEKTIELIKETGATEVALTDKNGMPDNLLAAQKIKEALPELILTTYYSLKNHTSKKLEEKYEHLKDYLDRSTKSGIESLLIVSGNPRPKFDTLEALEYIKSNHLKPKNIKLAVAYNPFYSNEELVKENERLEKKALSGIVDNVYLQIGTNTNALKKGAELIKKLLPNALIEGSLIVATTFLMNRFKFRPWKGVMVSDEFMSSAEAANIINKRLLKEYGVLSIKPIYGVYTITPDTMEALTKLIP
ncbi:MAG: hypothetical protein H7196_05030 [candidate division SR1 bacterium]|nr:hypothetical protein [candidate division SR1 bacterium]